MAFEFLSLPKKSQRAAFANMSTTSKAKSTAKPKTSGSASKKMSAAKKASASPATKVPAAGAHDRLSPGHSKGQGATGKDVSILVARYRLMHGRNPSPEQIARIRKAR